MTISSIIDGQHISAIRFSVVSSLPDNRLLGKQPGLAGPFSGMIGKNLVIAGGANFPDNMPWEGGRKRYWDDIYILQLNKKKNNWNLPQIKLPEPLAYGASVQVPGGLLCIGGENENGISGKVFLIHTDQEGENFTITHYPDLPIPLTNLSAVQVDGAVYVAGGESVRSVSSRFFRFDIDKYDQVWTELAPVPQPLSHGVMLVDKTGSEYSVYLFGGRKKNETGISDFYSTVFAYSILKNEWVRKSDMPYPVSAGVGLSFTPGKLLYLGGDKGETFHKVETLLAGISAERDESKKQLLIEEKNKLLMNHPGFSRDILEYDTKRDQWNKAGVFPMETPVTTHVVATGRKYYLPSGETRAGVRSRQIILIRK